MKTSQNLFSRTAGSSGTPASCSRVWLKRTIFPSGSIMQKRLGVLSTTVRMKSRSRSSAAARCLSSVNSRATRIASSPSFTIRASKSRSMPSISTL